jgi:malonate-semialdehyde dehydrogenase (acetylating)/methylmalonate-semialdehyde dehydrogenase
VKTLRNYIAGSWDAPEVPSLPVTNPATGSVLARVPLSGESEVDAAVRAARSAFPTWSATPAAARVAPLFSLREALIRREHELVRTLVAENGKSLADARAEIKRAIENLETACAMPLLQQGDKMVGCSTGIDGEVLRVPRGVLGLITPFNFPAMVPFWFLPYAVACGCTVVLKCSELTPCTVNLVTECLADLDLPPGVVNVVHGDRTAAAALAEHEGLDCLAFVGSTAVARHVYVRSAEKGRPCPTQTWTR